MSGAKLKLGPTTISTLNALGYDAKDSMKVKFNESYFYGGAVGYRFGDSFSAEIELDHAKNKVESIGGYSVPDTAVADFLEQSSVTLKQTNLLISGIYNHKLNDFVTLSLGAGLGAQFASANLSEGSVSDVAGGVTYTFSGKRKSDTALLAQLKTGVSLALAKNFTFDAGYKLRFVGTSNIYEASVRSTSINGSEKFSVDSRLNHVFSAGFTYAF